MQITIDSKDLLNIFIEAGIGQTDAKALILDIIMLQENPPAPKIAPRKELRQSTSTEHLKLKPVTQMPIQSAPIPIVNEEEYSIEEEEEEEEEEDDEERPTITRVNGKALNRPNFSSFGGDSTGLK